MTDKAWASVQEARRYLHQWLHDEGGRSHPTYGPVELNMSTFGSVVEGGCEVCLAGLWYLYKTGTLIDQHYYDEINRANGNVLTLLDTLRYGTAFIQTELGVVVDRYLRDELVGGKYDPKNPHHILLFMDWLLEQRSTNEGVQGYV